MKNKDNEKLKSTMTFNEKLYFFNKNQNIIFNNFNLRKSTVINYDKREEKPMRDVEKKIQIFQPRRTIVGTTNQLNLNELKKREKKENKYILLTEKEKNKENSKNKKVNKSYISSAELKKFEKSDIEKDNKKIDKKETSIKKKGDISNSNNNVSEIIKKINKIEEKNKIVKFNNDNKGTIKSIEKINNFNHNDKKNNYPKDIENEKNISNDILNKNKDINTNIINNRTANNNTNYIKEIKEIPNKTKKNENKILENAKIFENHNSKEEQDIIEPKNNNNENKKIFQNNIFKNILSLFKKELKFSQINKIEKNEGNKKLEEENDANLNINKELKTKERNENNKNNCNEDDNEIIETSKYLNKKPLNSIYISKPICNPQKDNLIPQNNQKDSPEKENNVDNNFNITKRFSRQINPNNFPNYNIAKKEIPTRKKETIVLKSSSSTNIPKIKYSEDNVNNFTNKLQYEILDKIHIKSESKTNSFCKAFFIVSLPKKNNKIIDGSSGIKSDCGHEECSSLPAFEPEIIYKYPEKDSKELELNNILASICFPNYIKVCYCEDEDKIHSVKNYSTCFTNQIGDRFYSMMFHFYSRINNSDFGTKYEANFFENITMKYSGEINENLDSKTQLINNINKKNYVYIPYCFVLVSKYPYFSQMEKCLQSLMLSINNENENNNEINEIITYLVRSVPSPYMHTSVDFPVPNNNNVIELKPSIYQEILLYGNCLVILLNKISRQNIILLFRLLLLEQKILLVSSDYDNLTKISLGLISLLYPLSWIHIYIPIITIKMLKYLQSFLPFFSGMHRSLYEKEEVINILNTSHNDLFIFDIDKNIFEISTNLLGKKRTNPIKFLNKNIPAFPKKIEDFIGLQLNILFQNYKRNPVNDSNILSINIKMKLLFIQAFIEMLYNYKMFLAIIDDMPVFNTNAYLKDKPEGEKDFYRELTSTQLYQIFIQNSLNYINNKNKNYYFDELIEDYLSKKDKNNNYNTMLINEFETKMNDKLFKTNKIYIINPSHLKLFKPIENQLRNPKGKKLLENINHFVRKEFKNPLLLNENGILKESKRIVKYDININNKNDIKEFEYYMTKEEMCEENENSNNKETDKEKGEIVNIIDADNTNLDNEFYDDDEQQELTDLEKEDIRDNIRGTLTRVFKSEKVNIKTDTSTLLSSLKKEYGKNYFVNVIIGNKNSKEIKIISEDSFKILMNVITKCLSKLKTTKKNMIFVNKILKPCSYFRAIVNKIDYLLDEKICENLTKNYNIFNEIFFWEFWVEEKIDENDLETYYRFKEISHEKETYYYIDEEDEKIIQYKKNYKILLESAKNQMIKMKLNKSTILSVIEALCNKYLLDEEFKKEQVKDIMKINENINIID